MAGAHQRGAEKVGGSLKRDQRRGPPNRPASGDHIDLHLIDANTTVAATGDQAFAFTAGNGTGAFTGHAGGLCYQAGGADTPVQGDTDGNGTADLAIPLTGHATLTTAGFIL